MDKTPYEIAFDKAASEIQRLLAVHKEDPNYIKETLYRDYRKYDPDGKAVRMRGNIKCTADGLLSVRRICEMEKTSQEILNTYLFYRKDPIFFFPAESGGINTSRYSGLGDKIDWTLQDIKEYYTGDLARCRLQKAYIRPKTSAWLKSFSGFEALIDWYGVKGIFTDLSYNVYDIETLTPGVTIGESKAWTSVYYENLKKLILQVSGNKEEIK